MTNENSFRIRVPWDKVEIDGDKQCAWVTIDDADVFLKMLLSARANEGKAVVVSDDC